MLEINPFSVSFFVNIFSHSEDFLYFFHDSLCSTKAFKCE